MKERIEQMGIQKVAILLVASLVLVVLSLPHSQKDQEEKKQAKQSTQEEMSKEQEVKALEGRLVQALSKVDGVGKVSVMITLKSSKESVVNKDVPYEKSEEKEGSKVRKSISSSEQTILVEEDGKSAPYVIKELEPEIEGVLVIAQGGEQAAIQKEITDAVMALFHVSANKVKVLKMEENS